MDSLTYHYQANTNKLNYIDDKQTGALSVYKGDLKDQAPNNYAYDAIGNLIQDTRDSITRITWTNAQKIDSIAKTDRSIWFGYDAMQNRVVKHSKANSSDQEKRTYYIRDAQGNIMATYQAYVTNDDGVITWDSVRLGEQHIYGSTRVGMTLPNLQLYPLLQDTNIIPIFAGTKRYELTNHLGNVLVVLSDRKHGKAASGSDIQWFDADVLASQQYYPFGMLMPDTSNVTLRRQYRVGGYDHRFGFNGKEGDDEVKGDDNQVDFGARPYDPRSGRWLGVDPLFREYSEFSSYAAMANNPIFNIDKEGKYFIGSEALIKELNRIYNIAYSMGVNGDERMKEFAASLQRMDASDIEFHLMTEHNTTVEGKGGETEFDFENNRVNIIVFTYSGDSKHAQTKEARFAHELEHGRQFLDGEVGFIFNDRSKNKRDKVGSYYLDQVDERKALLTGFILEKAVNSDMTKSPEKSTEEKLLTGYSTLPSEDVRVSFEEVDLNCGNNQLIEKMGRKPMILLITSYNYTPNENQQKNLTKEKNKIPNE